MRLGVAALVLAGCNQVFEIDRTEPIATDDRDADGVVDAFDNCPGEPNTDQSDSDVDTVGDVCDTCPVGSNVHDEDGDGISDGCDNCPQVANADQANADGDDLGDVCEHEPGLQRRLIFDGFERLRPSWIPGTAEWSASNDAVAPTVAPGDPSDFGLWNRSAFVKGTWSIEVGIEALPADRLSNAVGIETRDRNGADVHQCTINVSTNPMRLELRYVQMTAASVPIDVTGPVVLRLHVDPPRAFACDVGTTRVQYPVIQKTDGCPSLYSALDITRFSYVDVVETK